MNAREAEGLLSEAVPRGAGLWADLGAGEGTFTRALAHLLGTGSRIYAVDRDARAIATLEREAPVAGVAIIPVVGDFTRDVALPPTLQARFDGILLANALHFVSEPDVVLRRLVGWLRPGGLVVIVEYDRRRASRWVPYPITPSQLAGVATAAGLSAPAITATKASRYGGIIYVARSSTSVDPW